jgi:hypothetical protein
MSSLAIKGIACLFAYVLLSSADPAHGQGIAAKYVRDVGVENDPDVILTEMFEDSIAAIASRWNQMQNGAGMSLSSDVPAASGGTHSLLMTSVGGTNTGGLLYKNLGAGYDQVYLRYYIKYSSSGAYHHTGGWLGGYNPPTDWPQGGAGEKPTGSDRFSIGPEPVDPSLHFDLYTYWMEMRVSPDGVNYWGNTFIRDPSLLAKTDQWTSVEVMVKMNNPLSERNGELALWIDGTQIIHLRQGSPLGNWVFNMFTPNPTGTPFEGFRWRAVDLLKLNWILLQYYTTGNPSGFVGRVWWDHVVLAKKYVGPINTSPLNDPPPAGPTSLRVQ